MNCPLFYMAAISKDAYVPNEETGCLETECAWWLENMGKCCIAVESYLKGLGIKK